MAPIFRSSPANTSSSARTNAGRLVGADAARGLALIGMMAVHILPSTDPDGTVSTAYLVASGRSAALFAVLAGVGLGLAHGRAQPPTGLIKRVAIAGIGGRAVILGAVGLVLGELPSGVAVILFHYAFLFLLGGLFLGWRAPRLAVVGVLWAVFTPVVSHWLRLRMSAPTLEVPGVTELADPVRLLRETLLTGYYPVFPWLAYLLCGLAVGRSNLASWRVAAWLTASGAGLAVLVRWLSIVLLTHFDGGEAVGVLPVQYFGTTPTSTWWFLAVPTPHSGTPVDLLHTIGTSLAVLGSCLLLARAGRATLGWLAGAGAMTLSLYTAHVLALAAGWRLANRQILLICHVLIALIIGWLWRRFVGRGPLEMITAKVAGSIRASTLRASYLR
ncbi:MAG: heparan-alpha-glucosaminide N-acetyltransferase domain-containing protein [Actinomycetota bacterium]